MMVTPEIRKEIENAAFKYGLDPDIKPLSKNKRLNAIRGRLLSARFVRKSF